MIRRAANARRAGKSPSAQAGEYVRAEIHHVRDGEHGARSAAQVIAIGLSKARRAGVALPPSQRASAATRGRAKRDAEVGRTDHVASPVRSRASHAALEREGTAAASHGALSRHARAAARRRGD